MATTGQNHRQHPNIATIDVINHHQHIENYHFKGVGRRGRGTDTWKVILPFKVSLWYLEGLVESHLFHRRPVISDFSYICPNIHV